MGREPPHDRAIIGSGPALFAGALGLGAAAATQSDSELLPELLGAGLAYLPAVWLTVGLVTALFGVAPRVIALTWIVLGYAEFIGQFGDALDLPGWSRDLSPFAPSDAPAPRCCRRPEGGKTVDGARADCQRGGMDLDFATLDAGLDDIRESPTEVGTVELIARRPAEDEREVLTEAHLDTTAGLVGDGWLDRGADLDRQVTLMSARVIGLLAQARERWALAGDQLYVDLDLSARNLPPGTRLEVGSAVIEVTAAPHRGCKKFAARFGLDALRFVNSETGYELRMRGLNARVVRGGTVRTGDPVRKLPLAT